MNGRRMNAERDDDGRRTGRRTDERTAKKADRPTDDVNYYREYLQCVPS